MKAIAEFYNNGEIVHTTKVDGRCTPKSLLYEIVNWWSFFNWTECYVKLRGKTKLVKRSEYNGRKNTIESGRVN